MPFARRERRKAIPAEVASGLLYLDSSALVKLVLPEAETDTLTSLVEHQGCVVSVVAEIEVIRAAMRAPKPDAPVRRAREVLASLHLLDLTPAIRSLAGSLDPPSLRSLDAIHLASALSLAPDLGGFVVYDAALARAARTLGITVLSPR